MKNLSAVIISFLILFGCKPIRVNFENPINYDQRVILLEEGTVQFFYWEFYDSDKLWNATLGQVPELDKYKDTLKMSLGEKKYQLSIEKESSQNVGTSILKMKEEDGEKINSNLIHSGEIGTIRKINYLESKILEYQLNRFPLYSSPTEFHAFITKNDQTNKLRIYFGASDKGWPPDPKPILQELNKQENKEWKLIRHLHNHYCHEENPYCAQEEKYIGILAPSMSDAEYFKMLKENYDLEIALITNGFHTVEIKNENFEKFETHNNQ